MKKSVGNLMKKLLVVGLLLVAANFFLARTVDSTPDLIITSDTLKVVEPTKSLAKEDQLVYTLLSRYHYNKVNLNDSLSSVIFDRYINALDYNRSYFLASDIEEFEKYRNQLDDDIKLGMLHPAYKIFNVFRDRLEERFAYVDSLLNPDKPFDFTLDEKFQINRKDAPWPKTVADANEIWRKRIKNDALNLKLAGKDWKAIVETLKKRYDNLLRNVLQYDSEDVFQIYMNSYTEALDPHTNYLSPITSDNFKIDMSRSLEGIGAQLQADDEYTKVVRIIAGGPAFKSKLLHENDRIVGVAQGDDGEMVDVIGWRLNDVVQLIRGPKGSVVRLNILEAKDGVNAQPKVIKLVRDKVTLEEQSAKKDLLTINNDNKSYKIGVIDVPAFYSDYEAENRGDKNYKSTTRDVKKLIKELKTENVNGIIIDLRNNGGGSLQEAIQMSGLFIKKGPVVQVKNTDGRIDVATDPDTTEFYSGPLAVLVNRYSASASEIFSAAIQDYDRGLIIGEQTFGKGTVQNLIDLNRLMPSDKDKLGQVKLTISKFYRITGGSTQNKGVIPDIKFPSPFDPKDVGESSQPSALPWDQIAATKYQKAGSVQKFVPELLKLHEERVKTDPEYQYLLEDIKEYKEKHDEKYISLNESVRKKEKEEREQKEFERENERRKVKGLKLLKKGETPKEDVKADDEELNETAHILSDYIRLADVG